MFNSEGSNSGQLYQHHLASPTDLQVALRNYNDKYLRLGNHAIGNHASGNCDTGYFDTNRLWSYNRG